MKYLYYPYAKSLKKTCNVLSSTTDNSLSGCSLDHFTHPLPAANFWGLVKLHDDRKEIDL